MCYFTHDDLVLQLGILNEHTADTVLRHVLPLHLQVRFFFFGTQKLVFADTPSSEKKKTKKLTQDHI